LPACIRKAFKLADFCVKEGKGAKNGKEEEKGGEEARSFGTQRLVE